MLGCRLTVADWLLAVVGGQQIRRLGRVGEVESMSMSKRDSYKHCLFKFFQENNLSTHGLNMYLTLYRYIKLNIYCNYLAPEEIVEMGGE